jgi:hypothetical protein
MRKTPFTRKVVSLTIGAALLTFTLAGAVFTQATTTTTNEFVPFAQVNAVPCANGGAGELVLISGTLHILTHVTINGNRANIKQQFQPQGANGVGLTTGDSYNAVGGTKFHDTIPISGGAATSDFVNNFRLIGPGPNNNLQVHQNVHTTINANGDVTSTVDNTRIDCN